MIFPVRLELEPEIRRTASVPTYPSVERLDDELHMLEMLTLS